MNIPTWIIIFISIIHLIWSYIEISGFANFKKLQRMGYKPYYSTLSKTFTFAWIFSGIAAICYVIFG